MQCVYVCVRERTKPRGERQAGEKRQLMPACKHGGGGSECAEDMEAHGGHLYYLSPASNRSSTDDHRLGDVRVKYEIYQVRLSACYAPHAVLRLAGVGLGAALCVHVVTWSLFAFMLSRG
eukprot:1806843-Rhodomonas_salina.1